jgi:hypothetical protein
MRRYLLSFFFFLSFCKVIFGQSGTSIFDSLYALEDLRLTLTYPFDSMYKANQEEIDALLTIESKSGILLRNEEITLMLRGKFRRMKCEMPPLLLNFKKSTLRRLGLNEIDDVKLVTHCLKSPEGQENLLEENLCYKVYESIAPYAYRSLWVNVTYTDAQGNEKPFTSGGILLEPDKDIMSRYGLVEKKQFNLSQDSVHFDSYSRMVAYNCLIGNRDWSIVMSRNAKLFYDSTAGKFIVIPYDFDYSNIVAASYRRETRPPEMTNTHDRIYQGEYFSTQSGEILKTFLQAKATVLAIVQTAGSQMSDERRKKVTKYFETWFDFVEKRSIEDLQYGTVIPYKGGG